LGCRGPLAIRPATPADAPAIARVNATAGRRGWADFLPADTLARFEAPRREWEHRLARSEPDDVLVAVRGDEVVGFASLRRPPAPGEPGELGALYTHPDVWGAGVGRALMAAALARLRERGCGEAVLWTERHNRRARETYEAAGWRADGSTRRRDFLGHPIEEVRYRLVLTPGPER
jgi:ribosomal protein S18 acetylase RimI-like enzyme